MALVDGVTEILEELERQGAKSYSLSEKQVAETRDFINRRMEIVAQDYARKEALSEIAAARSWINC